MVEAVEVLKHPLSLLAGGSGPDPRDGADGPQAAAYSTLVGTAGTLLLGAAPPIVGLRSLTVEA